MLRTLLCIAAAVGLLQPTLAAESTELQDLPGNTPQQTVIKFNYSDKDYDTFIPIQNPIMGKQARFVPGPRSQAIDDFTNKLKTIQSCTGTFYDSTPCLSPDALLIRWDDVAAIIKNAYCFGMGYGPANIRIVDARSGTNPTTGVLYANAVLCFGKASETITPEAWLRQIDEKSAPTAELVARLGGLEQAILLAIGRCPKPEHRDWHLDPKTGDCCDPGPNAKEKRCP
jgi:hypothetical protein